ncbi:hypothetical protein Tco_0734564 [Tanacetum coccineum]
MVRQQKEQDGADGICDSKMSLTLQCHNGKNRNEKSGAMGSTIHSMIKFPTNRWKMSRIREQAILQTRSNLGQRSGKETMFPKEGKAASIQPPQKRNGRICIGMLRRTAVIRFFMEHQLKTYPLAEPVTYKKRPLTPDRRQALKEKVFKWLKEGIIRRVQHHEWVTNAILVKMANGAWHVHIDYSSLNRICAKDMYPFPKVEEELASLMGYPYKCFLQLPTKIAR